MKDEHFIKVYCSQELPKLHDFYDTEYGKLLFSMCSNQWLVTDEYMPTWWLKPIDLKQVQSENDQYKKAIAEQAIDYQKTIDKLYAEIERLKELS
jgi:hypothetical protein